MNYQVAVWKNSNVADPNMLANLNEHGWTHIDGTREPHLIDRTILPQQIVGFLQETLDAESDDHETVEVASDDMMF